MSEPQPQTFGEVAQRLDEIVDAVRSKDASLEESLDLLDEAIALGSRAVELVDSTELSEEELARADAAVSPHADGAPAPQGGAPAAPASEAPGHEDAPDPSAGSDVA